MEPDVVIYLADSPGAFLGTRPDWTLDNAAITWLDGAPARLSQEPFRSSAGLWEADVVARRNGTELYRLRVQIEPVTLRRWKQIGIDPVVEACAQVRDHLRRAASGNGHPITLL